jgi:hypothetical protein
MSGEELRSLLYYARASADATGDPTEIENAGELYDIFKRLRKLRRRRKRPLIMKYASVGKQLYPVPVDPGAHFQIWAIAPCGRAKAQYEDGLRRCFDKDRLKGVVPRAHHNLISMGLLVVFGETRIVLGGDIERAEWADIVTEFGAPSLCAHAVKVSHHGSSGAFDDVAWKHHAAKGKPVAIVTPFERFGLPEKSTMEKIGACASDLLITHYAPYSRAYGCDIETVTALWDEFKASTRHELQGFGRCTLVFDDKGKCEDPETVFPAMKWTRSPCLSVNAS